MIPGFHDAKIISVQLELQDDSLLRINTLHEKRIKSINVQGLIKLRVSDFEEGNIVSRVYSYTGHNCAQHSDVVLKNLNYVYKLSSDFLEKYPDKKAFIVEKYNEVIKGNLVLLEIEPAYGCYLVALGKNIEIEK
ncbi:MAG: hypothetical protein L3K25_11360 [Gammaproteobacteria bacterium]|nr:hypothetical protein [Gammaproteobacteria bacterium]